MINNNCHKKTWAIKMLEVVLDTTWGVYQKSELASLTGHQFESEICFFRGFPLKTNQCYACYIEVN